MTTRTATTRIPLGAGLALAILVVDQASKLWLLFGYELAARGRVAVMPFVDLVLVWNRGISYGLFTQDGDLGRWMLVAVTVAACIFLIVWLRRETSALTVAAIGVILGGAIGNGIDRIAWGAVVDFVLLHAGTFEWYVFNVADVAIVVGVALLLYGALRGDERGHDRAVSGTGDAGPGSGPDAGADAPPGKRAS